MHSRYRDIIFLLGAGASAEAGIPTSAEMVSRIEKSLQEDTDWKKHKDLYNHIKSAIYFASGLKGVFSDKVPYNIEILVNTLSELERNEQHPLYPFIASWNSRLISLAGLNFEFVSEFRHLILEKLKLWMSPDDTNKGNYYKGFKTVQQDFTFPIHVFSLNYDLCVERWNGEGFRIEDGFEGLGPDCPWNWERFEESESGSPDIPQMYLYKLHGSINWKRSPDIKKLYKVEQTASISAESMELIFGRDFKLEAADPYLFYLYMFRESSLASRLLVLIGYGFGDGHINNMLAQALQDNADRKILVVGNCKDGNAGQEKCNFVKAKLGMENDSQIIIENGSAKSFLEDSNLGTKLRELLPTSEDAPF